MMTDGQEINSLWFAVIWTVRVSAGNYRYSRCYYI